MTGTSLANPNRTRASAVLQDDRAEAPEVAKVGDWLAMVSVVNRLIEQASTRLGLPRVGSLPFIGTGHTEQEAA